MPRRPERRFGFPIALLLWLSFGPSPGGAQLIEVGGQFLANLDAREDVTWGLGPRIHVSEPMFGFSLVLSYDFYSPDCGTLECDMEEFGIGILWSFPVSFIIDPYLGGGMAFQKWEGQAYDGNKEDTGVGFLAGVALQGRTFARFRPFLEGRYYTGTSDGGQKVLAAGILRKIL